MTETPSVPRYYSDVLQQAMEDTILPEGALVDEVITKSDCTWDLCARDPQGLVAAKHTVLIGKPSDYDWGQQ